MKSKARNLAYFLKLKYPIQVIECEAGGYFVKIPDLPGCMSQGETLDEALRNLNEAKELWLKEMLESGLPISEPADPTGMSGRFLLRLPRSLHARLTDEAEREGVSLNQYVVARLAESPGSFVASYRPRPKHRS